MSNFTKSNISIEGGRGEAWAFYVNGTERKFVGRFKHGSAKASATHFVRFLIKNFTVEEYFDAYNAGNAPAHVLEQKGYVGYNMSKALKQMGYTPDQQGLEQWRTDRAAQYEAEAKAKQLA